MQERRWATCLGYMTPFGAVMAVYLYVYVRFQSACRAIEQYTMPTYACNLDVKEVCYA